MLAREHGKCGGIQSCTRFVLFFLKVKLKVFAEFAGSGVGAVAKATDWRLEGLGFESRLLTANCESSNDFYMLLKSAKIKINKHL